MAIGDRSLSDVFQDIVGNVQEIVRSEIRLAKADVREEAARAKASLLTLLAGGAAAIFAMLFLLLTLVNALQLVMPNWAAALVVGTAMAVTASVLLAQGMRQFRGLYSNSEQLVSTTEENVEWNKQHSK